MNFLLFLLMCLDCAEAEQRYDTDSHVSENIDNEILALQEELLTTELKEHVVTIGQLERDGTQDVTITALVARCQENHKRYMKSDNPVMS